MATKTQTPAVSSTRTATARSSTSHTRPAKLVFPESLLTVDDLAALPDTKPRYELIEGRLVQKMTTKRKHSQAAGYLLVELVIWARTQSDNWQFFPEGTGVRINDYGAYVPDVVGFAPGAVLDPEESIGGTPFLVAEVLSKSTSKRDRVHKLRDYASIGVQLYLIADPDKKTLEIHALKNGKYSSPQVLRDNDVWQPAELPELRLEVARLWLNSTEA